MRAVVELWGKEVGIIDQREDDVVASFQFAPGFDYDISPLLMPISRRVYRFPALPYDSFKGLAGVFADSLPDRFGNRVIDAWLLKQGRRIDSLTSVERLLYTGKRGMGALEYKPPMMRNREVSESLDTSELVRLAAQVLSDREGLIAHLSQERDEELLKIVRVGSSAGGARAKALVALNPETMEVRSGQVKAPKGFRYFLMKFDGVSGSGDHGFLDPKGFTNIEYAYYLMAREAGIDMMDSFLFRENGRCHFVTERFDRTADGEKLHMTSLGGLCHLDFNSPGSAGYEDAAAAIDDLGLPYSDKRQLFKRMAFNVVFRNQDDHVKNIAFLLDKSNRWHLAPAFDITFSCREDSPWVNRHQMTINGKRDGFTMDDFKEAGTNMQLKRNDYKEIIREVLDVLPYWKDAAAIAGVPEESADRMAQMFRVY